MRHLRDTGVCSARIGIVLWAAATALADPTGTAKLGSRNPFFAYEIGSVPGRPPIPVEQRAQMLKELGYDGIGYSGTQPVPEKIPEMLRALDARGLKMFSLYVNLSLDPRKPPYEPGLKTAIEQLKGRGTQIWLYSTGGKSGSTDADDRAVAVIRDIAHLAGKAGLSVALYPHTGQYIARVEDAIRLVKKVDRRNVGLTFNLCHFLKLDDEKNLEVRLKEAMPWLFAVNINGADEGQTNQMEWNRLIQTLDRGDLDVGRILKTLKQLGYTGPVGLQCYGILGDARDNLKRSMEAWRRLSRGLSQFSSASRSAAVKMGLSPSAAATAADNWPQFRGPEGNGRSDAVGLPVQWSETEHVKWKTSIHGRGWSSPVVWDSQIWMTTATDDGHEQYAVCVDRDSGKIRHDIHLFHNDKLQITDPLNSYASPTPVIEAGRVYVHFGVYGTACLDTATGTTLWTRRDIYCDHFRGPGSSPILVDDLLVFHMDGIDVQFVIALDKRTGKTVWKTNRSTDYGARDGDFRKAYCTPLLIDFAGRRQLICTAAAETMSYDPATGKELWKVHHEGYSNVARPVFGFGTVFISSGIGPQQVWAVRPDGQGDVTHTHVLWKLTKNVPRKPSPLLVDDLLYLINDDGVAVCVEAKTGNTVWKERIGGQFSASPLGADGRIYFFSHEGPATVIAPGRKFQKLAVNKLDDGFMASPAVSDKAIFLRTKTHLYRVEE